MKSTATIRNETTITDTMTAMVYWIICFLSGQMTFFISILVSLKNLVHEALASCAFATCVLVLRFALAMLTPQFQSLKLFCFFMQSVFMAPFTVFHHFKTFGRILFVLVCTIIAALAFCACKSNSFTHSLHLTQSFSALGQLTCLTSIS